MQPKELASIQPIGFAYRLRLCNRPAEDLGNCECCGIAGGVFYQMVQMRRYVSPLTGRGRIEPPMYHKKLWSLGAVVVNACLGAVLIFRVIQFFSHGNESNVNTHKGDEDVR